MEDTLKKKTKLPVVEQEDFERMYKIKEKVIT